MDQATAELLNNLSQKTPNTPAPSPKLTPVNYDPFAADNSPLARKGVGGDTRIVHMTNGDIGIPVEQQTPQLLATLASALGGDLSPYTVGSGVVKTNPNTGLQSFDSEGGGEGPGAEGGHGGGGDTGGPGTGADNSGGGTDTGGGGNSPSANNPNNTQDDSAPSPSGPAPGPTDGTDDSTTDTTTDTSSQTKSSTAVDESHGYTGISASDYAGPAVDLADKVSQVLNRAWESITDLPATISNMSAKDMAKAGLAMAVDTIAGIATSGLSTAGNMGSKAFGGTSIGQAMVDHGNDTTAGNPADAGNDPGLSGGGDGSQDGEGDPAIHLAKLVAGMQDAGIRSPASKTPNPAPLVGIPAPVAAPTLAPNPVGFIDPSVIMQQQGLRKFF